MKTKPTPRSEFLAAALRQFAKNGFAATTTRSIMADLGLSPGALYYYFSSKTDLLYSVLLDAYQPMLTGLEQLLKEHEHEGADVRLAEAVRYTTLLFIQRKSELSTVEVDRRFLEPERQAQILSLLRTYNTRVRKLVIEGSDAGLWTAADPTVVTNILFGIMNCRWYREGGTKTPEEIADLNVSCVFRVLQCVPPAERSSSPASNRLTDYVATMLAQAE